MFDGLSERLGQTVRNLRGVGRLTEENIKETLREVRMALLEADVALPVVKEFVDHVREKALGEEVLKSLTPGQALIKIVNDELVTLMGEANDGLELSVTPPAVILLAGLQGSGKTTSAGKLARWLQETQKKSVMLVSTDIYRPAAIDQLQTVAGQVEATFCPSASDEDPVAIAQRALEQAKVQHKDVLIVDTAGRLHIDETMMDEVRRLHETVQPVETLFVVDSMTGQDAANTARAFHDALPLTGVILTKTDGDARGGAALSIRQITGKPIKFLGTGEKTTALEPFHPDRVASRILGMGDVVSLVEEAQGQIDVAEAEKMAAKLKKGKGFDLEDFLAQFQQMKKMGGVAGLMDKLPGMPNVPAGALDAAAGEQQIKRMEAIIRSMTPAERRKPDLIKGSRKRRIAGGSGTQIQDVNRLLKQFTQMQKMMKKMKGGGMAKMMRGLKGGNLPPGLM